jgi:hypothetical protein
MVKTQEYYVRVLYLEIEKSYVFPYDSNSFNWIGGKIDSQKLDKEADGCVLTRGGATLLLGGAIAPPKILIFLNSLYDN